MSNKSPEFFSKVRKTILGTVAGGFLLGASVAIVDANQPIPVNTRGITIGSGLCHPKNETTRLGQNSPPTTEVYLNGATLVVKEPPSYGPSGAEYEVVFDDKNYSVMQEDPKTKNLLKTGIDTCFISKRHIQPIDNNK